MCPLNIGTQTEYDPYVKYNTKAGRWYVQDETGKDKEIQNPVFVADFANIKTGWLFFQEGLAPERVWDQDLSTPAPKPARQYMDKSTGQMKDSFKRGFSLRVFSNAAFGGVCELSSSSMHLCKAVNDLYTAFEAGSKVTPGKLPVVQYTGCTAVKDKQGTNYAPNFSIVKWIDRPAELTEEAAPPAPPQPVQQPQPAAAVPAAAPPPPAAPAAGSVSEF